MAWKSEDIISVFILSVVFIVGLVSILSIASLNREYAFAGNAISDLGLKNVVAKAVPKAEIKASTSRIADLDDKASNALSVKKALPSKTALILGSTGGDKEGWSDVTTSVKGVLPSILSSPLLWYAQRDTVVKNIPSQYDTDVALINELKPVATDVAAVNRILQKYEIADAVAAQTAIYESNLVASTGAVKRGEIKAWPSPVYPGGTMLVTGGKPGTILVLYDLSGHIVGSTSFDDNGQALVDFGTYGDLAQGGYLLQTMERAPIKVFISETCQGGPCPNAPSGVYSGSSSGDYSNPADPDDINADGIPDVEQDWDNDGIFDFEDEWIDTNRDDVDDRNQDKDGDRIFDWLDNWVGPGTKDPDDHDWDDDGLDNRYEVNLDGLNDGVDYKKIKLNDGTEMYIYAGILEQQPELLEQYPELDNPALYEDLDEDIDNDGTLNADSLDVDGDYIKNIKDNMIFVFGKDDDVNNNGIGDMIDLGGITRRDTDNDGLLDGADPNPYNPDIDHDGVLDGADPDPLNPAIPGTPTEPTPEPTPTPTPTPDPVTPDPGTPTPEPTPTPTPTPTPDPVTPDPVTPDPGTPTPTPTPTTPEPTPTAPTSVAPKTTTTDAAASTTAPTTKPKCKPFQLWKWATGQCV